MQVVYEKKEGVLLSLELKWRHNMNVSMPAPKYWLTSILYYVSWVILSSG